MELFAHNQSAYVSACAMLASVGKAAVIHPTGAGKSFIAFQLALDHPDQRICWMSPSEYIFQTQLENLTDANTGVLPNNTAFYTYAKIPVLTQEEVEGVWLRRWLSELTARLNGRTTGRNKTVKRLTAEQVTKLQSVGLVPDGNQSVPGEIKSSQEGKRSSA